MSRRWRTAPGVVALAGAVAACSTGAPPPPVPPAIAAPAIAVVAPNVDAAPASPPALPPPPSESADPILHSRWAFHADIEERTAYWRQMFSVRDAEGFPIYLERMGAYAHFVDSTLVAEGLPMSLRYLPIVESGYSTRAVSRASAVGLWQFMAPVARGFGMQVTPLVDERRDPVKSTLAAARYLRELEERFDSWFLALAAYNGGPFRVESLLRRHAPLAASGDSLFLVIAPFLPRETREFVPKLLAAAQVAEDPTRFGVSPPRARAPYVYDEVEVPDATSLDVVAEAAGIDEALVRDLNPQILRGVTPRGRATRLRLPPGTGGTFAAAYARIPEDRRVTVTEHVVRRGETLSGIALRYGIRTAELQAANPTVQPRRMRVGDRLMVPLVPGAVLGGERADVASEGGLHVVRSGESLWTIARRYRTTVVALRRLNGLREGVVLQPGDRLRVRGG